MEIQWVTLKNFKSHRDRHFVFQSGTNAICGENGAGKTSILEAIAWVIFDYKGNYKKEDFIHNGCANAQVTVRFISSKDGRTYDIQRCTDKGYTLYDPQLHARLDYKNIDQEVLPWLRQHIGVTPDTDLAHLFANTIGIPQGTFTADFLLSPEKRKRVFDVILKLEVYRQVWAHLSKVERYAGDRKQRIEHQITQYEKDLTKLPPTQEQYQQLQMDVHTSQLRLQALQLQRIDQQQQWDALAIKIKAIQDLENRVRQFQVELTGKQEARERLKAEIHHAQSAQQRCEHHSLAYQSYLEAEQHVSLLDEQLKPYGDCLRQQEEKQQEFNQSQNELTRLETQREALISSRAELSNLTELIRHQEDLEQQLENIANQLTEVKSTEVTLRDLNHQITKLKAKQLQDIQESHRLQQLEATLADITDLERQRDHRQHSLTRLEAARQFQAELQTLVSEGIQQRDRLQEETTHALAILADLQTALPLLLKPSVDAITSSLSAGIALNHSLIHGLQSILNDLTEQVDPLLLQAQLQALKDQLESAHRQRIEVSRLPALHIQSEQITTEINELEQRQTSLHQTLIMKPDLLSEQSRLKSGLQSLNNPKGRAVHLRQQISLQGQLEEEFASVQQNYQKTMSVLAAIKIQLSQYADLQDNLNRIRQTQETSRHGYLTYIQSQPTAANLTNLIQQQETIDLEYDKLQTQLFQDQQELEQLRQHADPQHWDKLKRNCESIQREMDQLEGALPPQHVLLQTLNQQINELLALAEEHSRALQDLKQCEKNLKFIIFARKAFKEAGPRIAERSVRHISDEADRLFRELLNRPNTSLMWKEDYEIEIQEGMHTRRFLNLSGGEQMCAALAVRLALLRVTANLDIAFFDEPTTNMDRPRRENLAEAICNIKSFRQLFVISHDDTFEKITENLITVTRDE